MRWIGIDEIRSFEDGVAGFAVNEVGVFIEFGVVYLPELIVTETDHALKLGVAVGKTRYVVLRSPSDSVHDDVEDVGNVERHGEAGSCLQNRL